MGLPNRVLVPCILGRNMQDIRRGDSSPVGFESAYEVALDGVDEDMRDTSTGWGAAATEIMVAICLRSTAWGDSGKNILTFATGGGNAGIQLNGTSGANTRLRAATDFSIGTQRMNVVPGVMGAGYHTLVFWYRGSESAGSRCKCYHAVNGATSFTEVTGITTAPASLNLSSIYLGQNSAGGNYLDAFFREAAAWTTTPDDTYLDELLDEEGLPADWGNMANLPAPAHWWRMGDSAEDDATSVIKDVIGSMDLTCVNMESGDIQAVA